MGRFVTGCALLLGLIGGASGYVETKGGRPIFPADPINGCKPGAKLTSACPVRMECFADSDYPNGGRCECNPLFSKKPSTLPFNESSEWDDGFSAADCENHHFQHFVVTFLFFASLIVSAALIYTVFVVIRELIRSKALKFNATGTSLVVLFIQGIAMFFVCLIYFANLVGLDRNEYWYERRTMLFTWFMFPAVPIIDFEIAVTWMDLYDRTNKMSKSSSKVVKAMRIAFRLLSLFLAFGISFVTASGGLVAMIISLIGPNLIGFPFVAIGGYLITKTLCPDNSDVANPNWKVCQAIRRGVRQNLLGKFAEVVLLLGVIVTNRHPQLGYFYALVTSFYVFIFIFRMWAWLHYLIFGSRKHLQKYASENASSYFGFSTVGLNKLTTTYSSRLSSTRSSAISSRPSVVG